MDPFDCPRCGAEMKMIALIDDHVVIEKVLRHLDLWPENSLPARAPPEPVIQDYIIEPVLEDCQRFDEAIAGSPARRTTTESLQASEAVAG